MKSVSFVLTEPEREFFKEYARQKGMTLSGLAKTALFEYESRRHKPGLVMPDKEKTP